LVPEAPTAADVLTSLQLDSSAYKGSKDWRDFVNEYGGDRKTYEACRKEHEMLIEFLGEENVEHLLRNVDGL
jgi:hypothetical protein